MMLRFLPLQTHTSTWLVLSLITASAVANDNKNGGDPLNLLMLGNSFSEAHHLEETLSAMISERKDELPTKPNTIYADRFEHHSANLTDYLGDEVSKAIAQERQWTWITLQEQSEIPGFYPPDDNDAREDLWDRSLETILQLNNEIQDAGATTILMQTWGYFDKDPWNPDIYKNYLEMQDHITKGYEYYYREIQKKRPGSNVKIAPCGEAFRYVYNDEVAKGQSPLAKGSRFDSLFEENESPRKHPSAEGAYLCACVLFQTLTGFDVRRSAPPSSMLDSGMSGLSASTTRWIQSAAYEAVAEEYGMEPPITKAAYQPSEHGSSKTVRGVFNFLFAFLLGGGVLAGWIGWKWHSAAGSVREQMDSSTFYKLLPDGGGGDNMLMELIDQPLRDSEPQWINPV